MYTDPDQHSAVVWRGAHILIGTNRNSRIVKFPTFANKAVHIPQRVIPRSGDVPGVIDTFDYSLARSRVVDLRELSVAERVAMSGDVVAGLVKVADNVPPLR